MNKDLLIVVPYRDREEHLRGFLENSPAYFSKQNFTWDILICELDKVGDWNAGLSVNSLIDFIRKENRSYEWLYIHHVDVWPVSGEWKFPEHNQFYHNIGDFGSCILKLSDFLKIEGYSNSFWGWGGEDNELYQRLKEIGLTMVDYTSKNFVTYNTGFQNHPRNFNGKNYANAIKQSMLVPKTKRTSIKNFSDHAETKNFESIGENIYKHTVCPKQKSPNDTINKKLIISYINSPIEFNDVVAYTKSSQMHAPYEFDTAVVLSNIDPNSWLVNQLTTFGINCFFYESRTKNYILDRYYGYKKFIEQDKDHEFILHTDITNSIFQTNPFEQIDLSKITFVKEKTKIITGAFSAGKDNFLKICDLVIDESKNFDDCDEIEHKIFDKVLKNESLIRDVVYKTTDDPFCGNLETMENLTISRDIHAINSKKEKYSIVYKYNFNKLFKEKLDYHFKNYYHPIY